MRFIAALLNGFMPENKTCLVVCESLRFMFTPVFVTLAFEAPDS